LANLAISGRQLLEGLGLLEFQFPHPVQGEPVKEGGVVRGAAHPKELPLEALVGLLEEREKDSPNHTTKTHPEVLPGVFGFEEVKEDVDRWRVPKVQHKMEKALINAQLLGCSWAGATLISVNSTLSKPVRGRHSLIHLKAVW